MKRSPSTLQKSTCMLMSLSLSSCQVSPQWAAQTAGGGYGSRPLTAISHVQQQAPMVYPVRNPNQPNQGLQVRSPYTHPPVPATYLTASTVAQPTPVVVPHQRVFVAQPQPKIVAAPQPRPRPQTSQTSSIPRGKVRLVNGRAIAPSDAPAVVRRVVDAGNRMQKFPYKWGGGHAQLNDTGYDCSGAVSYILREAGIMPDQRTSRGFLNFGEAGEGDWITVWAKDGHVFVIVGGLRLDTGGSTTRTGPRWKTKSRHYKDFVARHPRGL